MKRVVQSVTRLCMLATRLPNLDSLTELTLRGYDLNEGLGPRLDRAVRACVRARARACVRACVFLCVSYLLNPWLVGAPTWRYAGTDQSSKKVSMYRYWQGKWVEHKRWPKPWRITKAIDIDQHLQLRRSCMKVEVSVLGFPSDIIVRTVSATLNELPFFRVSVYLSVFGIMLCACCSSASSLAIRTGIFSKSVTLWTALQIPVWSKPHLVFRHKVYEIALSEVLATQMGVTEAQHQSQLVWIVQIWPVFASQRVDSAGTRA